MIKAALQPVRRAGQRGFDIALGDRERAEKVGLQSLVDNRRAGGQRRFGARPPPANRSSSAVTNAAASSAA